jgi:glycolate oxidase
VATDFQKVLEACKEGGATSVRVAANEAEREVLWGARRAHYPALARAAPTVLVEDMTVPRESLPEMVARVREAAKRYELEIGLAAHAGDGNIHPDILTDQRDPELMARSHALLEDFIRAAIDLKGTLTGEHGIGSLKAPYLPWLYGEAGVGALRAIKRALDPNNILNPGKVLV